MSEPFRYPEERSQERLMPSVMGFFPHLGIKPATENALQNGFAVFSLFDGAQLIAKFRISVTAELKDRVELEDVELLSGFFGQPAPN